MVSRTPAWWPPPPTWTPRLSTIEMPFRCRVLPTDPVTRHMSCSHCKPTLYQPACFMLICRLHLHQSSMLQLLPMGNRMLRLRGTPLAIGHHQVLSHFLPGTLRRTYRLASTLYLLLRANQITNLPFYLSWQIEVVDLLQNTGESTNMSPHIHFNLLFAHCIATISHSLRSTRTHDILHYRNLFC